MFESQLLLALALDGLSSLQDQKSDHGFGIVDRVI